MKNTKWVIDPDHSEVGFKVKHLMISNVKGNFSKFEGTIDGEDFTKAPIHVKVATESVSTNSDDRDKHLRSEDFFNADKYGEMTFKSKSIEKVDDDEYKLKGDLTIKDTTNEVELDVEFGGQNKDPWGNQRIAFEITGKINRKDWGLNWNSKLETGGVLVGDEVKLNAEVQFIKQEA